MSFFFTNKCEIIRTAARIATAFKGRFTALFVETPDFKVMEKDNVNRLRQNIKLAMQLGASIETVYSDDIAFQISEFSRLSGVSKIVLGRSNVKRKHIFSKPTLTEQLTSIKSNIDIYIIPDNEVKSFKHKKDNKISFNLSDTLKTLIMLILATGIGIIFDYFGFSETNIIMIYILFVLITSIITSQRIYSLILSVVSVLSFNFFFTYPKFTFQAYDGGYPVTFLIMFICAFITNTLAVRLKQHAKQSAIRAYRTSILFETNQFLQKAKDTSDIISVTANQLTKLLNKDIIFYNASDNKLKEPIIFLVDENIDIDDKGYISENEKAVANWVFKNNKQTGATTNTLGNAKCLYLAIRSNDFVYGVVGIVIKDEPLNYFENSLLLSILGECALALENQKVSKER